MNITQDNHDKITIATTKEEIIEVCKKVYRWRKDVFQRFQKLGSKDYDYVIYCIHKRKTENAIKLIN